MEIYDHAVDQYLERIKNKSPNTSSLERVIAKRKIKEAVEQPDKILSTEEDKPQIHVKDNVAVIVGVRGEHEGHYEPYSDFEEDNLVVPTVYKSQTFLNEAS